MNNYILISCLYVSYLQFQTVLFVESNWNFILNRIFAFQLKRIKKYDVEFN